MSTAARERCRRHRVPKRFRMVIVVLSVLLGTVSSAVVAAPIAGAATDTVTNCSGSASADGSLPYVVAHAASGDTITFSPVPACTSISLAGPINLVGNLTIAGPGASSLAVSGHGAVGVFIVHREPPSPSRVSPSRMDRAPGAVASTTAAR